MVKIRATQSHVKILTVGLIFTCWIIDHGLLAMPTRSGDYESSQDASSTHQPSDYVRSDEEFERLLERLSAETATDSFIAANPSNFVRDDISLEELIQLLELRDQQAAGHLPAAIPTTLRPADSDSDDDIDGLLGNGQDQRGATSAATIEGVHAQRTSGLPANAAPLIATATVIPQIPTEAPLPMIGSDAEWEEVLKQLREEAAESINHPANYANSDDELSAIIERLSEINASPDKHLERWQKGLSVTYVADECPICQEEMTPEDEYSLRCKHNFHENCLRAWARTGTRSCPMCRRNCVNL